MKILQVENGSFTPLVFSISWRMGRKASKYYSQIAEILPEKRDETYLIRIPWIRRKLSLSLMRSIIACIKGSKIFKSNKEKQCTSEVSSNSETTWAIEE